jgi:hypothetical protein
VKQEPAESFIQGLKPSSFKASLALKRPQLEDASMMTFAEEDRSGDDGQCLNKVH